MFEQGDLVIKVISVFGSKSATVQKIYSTEDGKVQICDPKYPEEEGVNRVHYYDPQDGTELIGPAKIPGCTSYLVPLDDGEEVNLLVGFGEKVEGFEEFDDPDNIIHVRRIKAPMTQACEEE